MTVELSTESMEVLWEHVKRGASVIVDVKAYSNGHFCLLVGQSRRNWYFMDPSSETGFGYVPKADFPARFADHEKVVVRGRVKQLYAATRIPE